MRKQFEHLVVGGTFDLLHKGHERLIDFAFKNGSRVTIGLTSQRMVLNFKKKVPFLTFDQRHNQLKNYLESKGYSDYKIVEIDDLYGVALMDKTIDGIVVSTETESGALKINTARARLGLQKLDVLVVPLVHDANGEKLSSERIISGKTDRAGEVYQSLLKHKSFKLPGMLRKKTAEPLGMIVQDEKELIKIVKRSTFVVAVGDEVTRTINRGAKIDLAIVDFLINRQKQIDEITELGFGEDVEVLVVKNDAGTISRHLSDAVIAYFSKPKSGLVIKVDGEEDLAVVPVILCAPLNTLVVYGQRGKGAVVVKVGELVKERVRALLSQFKIF